VIEVRIVRTDEMIPKWFALPASSNTTLPIMPFDRMWQDAQLWIPVMLTGQKFIARFDFGEDSADGANDGELIKWWIGARP
jgi:8-oxo-dGTP diphosphatase/2-hydroxy-dATP diphosphatase